MSISEEYRALLALFPRIIDSITPLAPEELPPFVLWRPSPLTFQEKNH